MKKITLLSLALLAIVALTGCADVVQVNQCLPMSEPVGFWYGAWHGMILQISFICSLFSDNVAIYAINNNGGWYNFGFVGGLGVMIKILGHLIKAISGK